VKLNNSVFTLQYTKMKTLFTVLLTSCLFAQSFAQLDSLSIGADGKDISFYSLSSKAKTTIPNDDWHLAFSRKGQQFPSKTLQAATIRINEANGVSLYKIPALGLNDFDMVDTTGWRSWEKLHDSDTLIWMGAFNQNLDISQYNYGWGGYNQATHDVTGNSLFLVELPNGDLKKLAILRNQRDTAFVVRYSPITANSQDTTLFISKLPYSNNFSYVNLNTTSIADREPIAFDWDINFSVYADADGNKKVGLLLNNDVTALPNQTYNPADPCPTNITFNDHYNALGSLGNSDVLDSNVVADNVSYIRTANGRIFSLQLSNPDIATNTIYFTTTLCSGATSIMDEKTTDLSLSIYPNPANDIIEVKSNATLASSAQLKIYDVAGKLCHSTILQDSSSKVNIAHLENGVYFIKTIISGKIATTKLVVNK
jgi:hypothetical protein